MTNLTVTVCECGDRDKARCFGGSGAEPAISAYEAADQLSSEFAGHEWWPAHNRWGMRKDVIVDAFAYLSARKWWLHAGQPSFMLSKARDRAHILAGLAGGACLN